MPKSTKAGTKSTAGVPSLDGMLWRLIYACFLMGAASTAIWSFGAQLVKLRLDWSNTGAGLLWIAIGAAGIAGAGAGALTTRFGIDRVHRVFLGVMAAGILLVGVEGTSATLTLIGGALFGAAYIMVSGVYLVWGVSALPERPATGLMIGFLTLAIGQTAGAAMFGLLMDQLPANHAVSIFVGLALAAGTVQAERSSRKPRLARP